MAFSEIKLVDLNIFHHIREQVLYSSPPLGEEDVSFDEYIEDDILDATEILELGITVKSHKAYRSSNRNWIYYDTKDIEIVIKKNGYVIGSSDYIVNYNEGIIVFTDQFAGTLDDVDDITADYYCMTVNVMDGYPYDKLKKPEFQNNLPVVAVEYMDGVPVPYELGGTEEELRSFTLHVLASSDSERDDLAGIIAKSLKASIPIIDYRQGMPLNFDGSKNSEFGYGILDKGRILFENIRNRTIRLEDPLPIQRFWNVITLSTRSFI